MSSVTDTDLAVPEGFVQYNYPEGFITTISPIYLKITEDEVSMGFHVLPKHVNPVGICHGGMMMTLLDMAVGQAVLHKTKRKVFPPSIQMSYDFLQPANLGEWLQSEISFVHDTPRMGFASGYLVGPNGPVIRCNGICKLPKEGDSRFTRLHNPLT